MRLHWLLAALVLASVLSGFSAYNLSHEVYFTYWWADIPMHLLGGAAVAAFVVGLLPRPQWVVLGLTVAAVSIGWEIFEYVFDIAGGIPSYALDTTYDLCNDAIGAVVTYVVARKTLWR